MVDRKIKATLFALSAALFYALNIPFSKQLLQTVPPTLMASFLYFGAGIGVGLMYLFHWKKEKKGDRLAREDLPYTIGMIVLDILAPIFLMLGISIGSSANASLLGNFEIVATSLIALLVFKEKVSKKLWTAITLITISSTVLSFEGSGSFQFSVGSVFVLRPCRMLGNGEQLHQEDFRKEYLSNCYNKGIVLRHGFFCDCKYNWRIITESRVCGIGDGTWICSVWP